MSSGNGATDQIRRYGACVQVDDYNQLAIRALERAQKTRGVRSAEAFARLLAERTGGYPSSSTYHRWLRGESPIPVWVVLVAAEEADATVDTLLAEAALPRSALDRLDQVEQQLAGLRAEIARLQEQLADTSPEVTA
jgi:hypothetical protein